MTRDDIIRRAQEVRGILIAPLRRSCCREHRRNEMEHKSRALAELEMLRQMLAAINEEREACAKLCEEDGLLWGQRYAAAIRARGEK